MVENNTLDEARVNVRVLLDGHNLDHEKVQGLSFTLNRLDSIYYDACKLVSQLSMNLRSELSERRCEVTHTSKRYEQRWTKGRGRSSFGP